VLFFNKNTGMHAVIGTEKASVAGYNNNLTTLSVE